MEGAEKKREESNRAFHVRFGLPKPRTLGYFSSVRGSYDPTDMVTASSLAAALGAMTLP